MNVSDHTVERCVEAVMDLYGAHGAPATEEVVRCVLDEYGRARGLRDLERDLRVTLDQHYPTDVFLFPVAPDRLHRADPGVRFVYRLREALEELGT